jgi:fatty acid desaturase
MVVAWFMSWLGLLAHEAGHNSLTRSPALNALLGRLAFLPSWMPFSAWVASHNRHHAFTNVRGLDPFWAPLSPQEFARLARWRRVLERFYRTPFGVGLYALVELWGRAWLFPEGSRSRRHRAVNSLDRLAVVGMAISQVMGLLLWRRWLGYSGGATSVLACVVLPFLQVAWWTGFVGFLHHTPQAGGTPTGGVVLLPRASGGDGPRRDALVAPLGAGKRAGAHRPSCRPRRSPHRIAGVSVPAGTGVSAERPHSPSPRMLARIRGVQTLRLRAPPLGRFRGTWPRSPSL